MQRSEVFTQRVRFSNFKQKSSIASGSGSRYIEVMGYTPEILRNSLYDLKREVELAIREVESDMNIPAPLKGGEH